MGVCTGNDNLGAARRGVHRGDIDFDPLTREVTFAVDLLARRHDGGGATEVDEYDAALDALHGAGEDFADLVFEFLVGGFALGFPQPLDDYLFGSLGGHAAIVLGREQLGADLVADLCIRFDLGGFGERQHRLGVKALCFGFRDLSFGGRCSARRGRWRSLGRRCCGRLIGRGSGFRLLAFSTQLFKLLLLFEVFLIEFVLHDLFHVKDARLRGFGVEFRLDILILFAKVLAVGNGKRRFDSVEHGLARDILFFADLVDRVENRRLSHEGG